MASQVIAQKCCGYNEFHNKVFNTISEAPGLSHVKWMLISPNEDDCVANVVKAALAIFTGFIGIAVVAGAFSILKTVCQWCVSDSNETVAQEKKASEEKIVKLESQIADLKAQMLTLTRKINANSADQVGTEMTALQDELRVAKETLAKLSQQILTLSQELDKQIKQLQTDKAEKEAKITGLDDQMLKLANAPAAADESAQKLQEDQKGQLKAEKARLQDESAALETRITESTAKSGEQIHQLETEKGALKDKIAGFEQQIQMLTNQQTQSIQALNDQVVALKEELAQVSADRDALGKSNELKQAEVVQLTDANRTLEAALQGAEGTAKKTAAQVQQLAGELEALRKSRAALEETAKDQFQQRTEENEALRKSRAEFEATVARRAEDFKKIEADLTRQVKEQATMLGQMTQSSDELKLKIARLQAQNAAAAADLTSSRTIPAATADLTSSRTIPAATADLMGSRNIPSEPTTPTSEPTIPIQGPTSPGFDS